MKAACVTAGIVAVALAAAVRPSAQTSPETLKGIERLEGDWVRADPNGSGDFGGLTSKFTPASLTPQAAADMQADPFHKIEHYRRTIRVDYACELAHQKLSQVAHELARGR